MAEARNAPHSGLVGRSGDVFVSPYPEARCVRLASTSSPRDTFIEPGVNVAPSGAPMSQRSTAASFLASFVGLTVAVCAGCSSNSNPGSEGTIGTGGASQASSGDQSEGGATTKSSTTKTARGGTNSTKSNADSRATGGKKSTPADSDASGGADATEGGGSSAGGKSSKSASSSTGGSSNSKVSSGGKSSTGGSSNGAGGAAAGGASAGGSKTDAAGGNTASEPSSCPATVLKAGDTDKTIKVGSGDRKYLLHVPAKYDGKTAVPLVIDFHGITGDGKGERSSSPYPAQTDPEGVIMAFPTGASGPMGNAWNVGPCCVANVDDVAFAKAIVADIQAVACIDAKRVYAVGFSMGGGMSHYLACHAADVFAAVAPAAFDLLEENVGACKPARPISVISFRGTADGTVSYAGGDSAVVPGMPITFLGAKNTFAKWAEINQCTGSPSAEDSKGCSTYSSCKDGVEVTLCTKQGGGHAAGDASVGWPSLKKYTLP